MRFSRTEWSAVDAGEMPVSAQVQYYLNAKLTATGAGALPYDERLKFAVRDQLLAVVEVRPRATRSRVPSTLIRISDASPLSRSRTLADPTISNSFPAEVPVAERPRRTVHAQRRPDRPPPPRRGNRPDLLPRRQVQHPAQDVPPRGVPSRAAHLLRHTDEQHDHQARTLVRRRERARARPVRRTVELPTEQPDGDGGTAVGSVRRRTAALRQTGGVRSTVPAAHVIPVHRPEARPPAANPGCRVKPGAR